jgi:superinfection exclusion protein B
VKRHRSAEVLTKHFENLASDHISILLEYVQTGKNSIHFSPTNGAVQDLVYKGILYRPFQQMRSDGMMAYNVTAQASEFLRHDRFQEVLAKNKNQPNPTKHWFSVFKAVCAKRVDSQHSHVQA